MVAATKTPPTPVLRKETVEDLVVLGAVVVRSVRLSERLALKNNANPNPLSEAPPGDAFFARLLAMTVTKTDGKPLFAADEWDIFGADDANAADMNRVLEVALRLGGFGGTLEKKA